MNPIKRWYLTMAYAANVQMVRLSLRNSRGCRPGSIGRIGALRDAVSAPSWRASSGTIYRAADVCRVWA